MRKNWSLQLQPLQPIVKKSCSIKQNQGMIIPMLQLPSIQQSLNSSLSSQISQDLDLVYFYGEPIVYLNELGEEEPVEILDFEGEYKGLISELKSTGKQFRILRQQLNINTLSSVIHKNPKIIHISSHGAFDIKEQQFYLAVEGEGIEAQMGQQVNLNQQKVSKILGSADSNILKIKLAFISACQSEEMGNIFLEAGIPVVIAVNSTSRILDKVCKNFMRIFYQALLDGATIRIAFESAKNSIDVISKDTCTSCCCAHDHEPDCWWKLYSATNKDAHEIHFQKCRCNLSNTNEHRPECDVWRQFKQIRTQFLKTLKPPRVEKSKKRVICCCKPDLQHSEAMKFKIKFLPKNEHLLDETLFSERKLGRFINDNDQIIHNLNQNQVQLSTQSELIFGRNKDIIKIIRFMNNEEERVLFINGIKESDAWAVAKQAVKYVLARNKFEDGSININALGVQTQSGIQDLIIKQTQFSYYHSFDNVMSVLGTKNVILLIQNVELDNFLIKQFLYSVISQTPIKVIVVREGDDPFEKNDHMLDQQKCSVYQEISTISDEDHFLLMLKIYKRIRQNRQFKQQDIKKEHPLFKIKFTPSQIRDNALLYDNGTSLDKIVQIWEAQRENKEQEYMVGEKISKLCLEQMQKGFQNEINMAYVLSFSKSGLREFDMIRIDLMSQQSNQNKDASLYGDWMSLIKNFTQEEGNLQEQQTDSDQETTCTHDHTTHEQDGPKEKKQMPDSQISQSIKVIQIIDSQGLQKYSLTIKFRDYLLQACQTQAQEFKNQYLKYMSILSRQLLWNIKKQSETDFDPYILSSVIDDGFWREPATNQFEMVFKDQAHKIFDKFEHEMERADQIFKVHEDNLLGVVIENQGEFNYSKDTNSQEYFEEITVNTVSILIELNRIPDALKLLSKIDINEESILFVKIFLISKSLLQRQSSNQQILNSNIQFKEEKVFNYLNKKKMESKSTQNPFEFGLGELHYLNAILSNQCQQQRSHFAHFNEPNIQQELQFEEQLNHLELARKHFGKNQISCMKTWIMQANFIFKQDNSFELQINVDDQELMILNEMLEDQLGLLVQVRFAKLYCICLLHQAGILYQLKKYQNSRDKILECVNSWANYEVHPEISRKLEAAQFLLQEIIKNQNSNLIMFAGSNPLFDENQSKDHIIFPVNFESQIMKVLDETDKQLNIQHSILSKEFLQNIHAKSPKVLHLRPKYDSIENQTIVLEDSESNGLIVGPSLLKSILSKENAQTLKTLLVVIEMTNCEEICQVFIQNLGMVHVIAFQAKCKCKDSQLSKENIQEIKVFMDLFSKLFYASVLTFNKYSILKAKDNAYRSAKERVSKQLKDLVDLKIAHFCRGQLITEDGMNCDKLDENLYNNEHIKRDMHIKEGLSYEIHKDQGKFYGLDQTDLNQGLTSLVFEPQNINNVISALKKQVNQDNNCDILNFFGKRGVGKSQIVVSTSQYLLRRKHFKQGVQYLNLLNISNFNQLKSKLLLSKQQAPELGERSLLILDDCEDFINQNRISFFENIYFLSQEIGNSLMVVLITEKKLAQKKLKIEYKEVHPLGWAASLLLLKSQMPEISKESEIILYQQIQKSAGIPQLLQMVTKIYQFGGLDILQKIQFEKKAVVEDFSEGNQMTVSDAKSIIEKIQNVDSFSFAGSIKSSRTFKCNKIAKKQSQFKRLDEYYLRSNLLSKYNLTQENLGNKKDTGQERPLGLQRQLDMLNCLPVEEEDPLDDQDGSIASISSEDDNNYNFDGDFQQNQTMSPQMVTHETYLIPPHQKTTQSLEKFKDILIQTQHPKRNENLSSSIDFQNQKQNQRQRQSSALAYVEEEFIQKRAPPQSFQFSQSEMNFQIDKNLGASIFYLGFTLEIFCSDNDLNLIPVLDSKLFQIFKKQCLETKLGMSITKSVSSRYQNQTTQLKSLEYTDLLKISNVVITLPTDFEDLEVPQEIFQKIESFKVSSLRHKIFSIGQEDQQTTQIGYKDDQVQGNQDDANADKKKESTRKKVTMMTEAIEGQVTTTGEYQFSCSSSDS